MKRNYFLNFTRLLCIVLLTTIFGVKSVSAWDFIPAQHISNFTVDKGNKTVSFTIVAYHEIGLVDDDNLWYAEVLINGVNYFDIINQEWFNAGYYGASGYPSGTNEVSLYSQAEDTWRFKRYYSQGTLVVNPRTEADITYLDITIPLNPSEFYDENYILSFSRLAFEDGGADYGMPNGLSGAYTLSSIPGWEDISLANFNASDNSCNTVSLSWTISTGVVDDINYELYADGSLINSGQNTSSFSDNLGSNPTPVDRNYNLQVGYGSGLKRSVALNTIGGPPRTGYTNVSTFTATDHTCGDVTLAWDDASSGANTVTYLITRIEDNVTYTTTKGQSSYLVSDQMLEQDYTYRIQSVNECSFKSSGVTAVSNVISLSPPNALTFLETPNGGLKISWPDGIGEDSYTLSKLFSGTTETIPNIPADSSSYQDDNVQSCVNYTYTIKAINDCNPNGLSGATAMYKLVPGLTNTFTTNNLRIDKGYSASTVHMEWTPDQNSIDIENYVLLRRVLDSNDPWTQIETVNGATNQYDDNTTLAGVLYEYKVFGTLICENELEFTDTASAIGFRSPFGTVAGQVNYTGGIAVKDVKISAESSSGLSGSSLLFSGTQKLQIASSSSMDANLGLSLEMWLRPTSHAVDFTLVEKANSFKIKHKGSAYEFTVFTSPTDSQSLYLADSYLSLNNYNQLTTTLFNDTLRIYLNGNTISSSFAFLGGAVNNNTNPLEIGQGFSGNLDEFRYYVAGKSQKDVNQSFSRILSGTNPDLKVYLRMNENAGAYAYDFSHVGTNFNKNHALITGNPSWSAAIPSGSQLSSSAYTDAAGNYLLIAPYVGVGETFTITPSYLTHNFNPSTRSLFIGEGAAVHNNANFEDISSFTVQGSLFYENTSCAVEGARLLIDGSAVLFNGTEVKTDAQGNFLIQVPIGQHYVSIEKQGHFMNVGRFPETGTYNFQDDLAGMNFKDSTLMKVVGRVVGGLKQASYIPGKGKSKNNIGVATIVFTSQQGNGCYTDTVYTDTASGEFITYVPPIRYIPTVSIESNPTIDFGVLNLVDLAGAPAEITKYDSLGGVVLDSIKLNKQLDYIYRVDPQIVVKEQNRVNDFIGDTTYTYNHPNGTSIVRNLRTNPMPWPVFGGIGQEVWYTCLITAFEEYVNLSTGELDTVPTTDGRLLINNDICVVDSGDLELSEINSLDTLKYLYYKFLLGSPNFLENINIPQYSYVKAFQVNVILPTGATIEWKPDVFRGNPSGQFSAVYDNIFRGYVLGTKSDGQQFITAGPQVPEYVLRDPPGSNSSASRGIATTKVTSNSWKWSLGTKVGTEDDIYVGTDNVVGLGVGVKTEVKNNINAGFSATVTGGNSGNESITITNTQEWATNSGTDLAGVGSDLYIGKSKNVTFGISKTLKIVPDSICSQIECIGDTFSSLSFANSYGLSIVPEGYETQFIYNQSQITTYLIPDLINFRNALLQSDPRYIANPNVAIDSADYGKNNDDIAFNPLIPPASSQDRIDYLMNIGDSTYMDTSSAYYSNLTLRTASQAQQALWDSYNETTNPDFSVLSGPSYTYLAQSPQDSLTGDSVRWINNQIKHWEDAIMLNEWEKVNIGNVSVKQKLKEVELRKIVDKYKQPIKAFDALSTLGGFVSAGSGLASVLIPVPGAAFIGYASFAVTTGTGIGMAEVYEEVLQFENQKDLINDKYAEAPANYSISGGNTFSSSTSHESASTYTNSVEYGMSVSLALEVAAKVSGNGFGYRKSIGLDFSSSRDWSETTSSTETVSFTLDEPDQGDYFSVDMYPSLLGWGPVFKLRPGGRTSCPHEDAVLTEYYMDLPANAGTNINYPSFELSARTLQRDKPTVTGAPALLSNIPVTNAAAFNLTVNNESESNDPRNYVLALHSPSNPFGAIVKIDGVSPNVTLSIPPLSSVNKVVTISKGPGPVYDYDSILMLVYAPCQYQAGTSDNVDIVDSVYISAHFTPTCTEVNFATPDDQWVLNNNFLDTMPVAIIDYDVNFFDFNSIRLDYKPSSSPQWVGLQTFYRDTSGLNNSSAIEIPSSTPFTLWDWETDQIVDGDYDLRLVSQCTLADKTSPTHTGLMDRINPHPFGTPSPADGILDPEDDISIRFNEPIDLGSLTSLNFDVRGVINGSETTHASNLYFDGVGDFVEVTGGAPLQRRDFTIEFSVKRGALGTEPILAQGPHGNEQIYVGFDNGDHLECRINGQSVNSLNTYTDNDWHYFAVAYSYTNETVEIYEASATTTAAIVNTGDVNMYAKYAGDDKLFIGKDLASASFFTGNLDDVRIWNVARSLNEFSLMKSIQLSSNEPGLLFNWRFDEAQGIFAKDHVRSRDGIINGAEWTVEPGGNALALDGVDDYLRIKKGDVNITQGMDYTLEFWYNSIQDSAATLVSTGKGDGLGADSLFAWNIAKDTSGLIHVYHNGEDFVATNSNTFDGEWHHFALVLNRQGNLTSYLDGNLESSVQATPYKDLGGPAFYIGARGYYQGSTEVTDNYFEGALDEFRFWDASRKFEQITRDKHNRMKGDEYALRIYMPFEDYQLDPTGIAILTPSFDEQIDLTDTVYVVTNPNGALLSALTPKIKVQRPVESIAFTYSVNNDEIIITPTTNQALIENVTLDITVKNVKDLHGNVMESPKTWIAYIDKNQVVWQDDLLAFEKDFGDNLSFSSSISNEGGAAKNFTIENIPDWLSASPTNGIIQPNSQLTINFEVDPNVNIGDYSQDVHLLTDFGFPEKLTIDLKVREEEPNWTVNPADFDYSMSIIGYLKIKEVVSTSEEDILAAFVDGECRGVAHLQYMPQIDRYLVFLDVYSNVTDGENVIFKIWDASSGINFTEVSPAIIPFIDNDVIGTVNNPQLFETNYEIAFDIPVVAGWNWIGYFLFNSDSTNLDATLASLEAETGDEIKTLTHGFSSYLDTIGFPIGWSGDINGQGIRPELGYKLKVSKVDTLVLKGDILDPTSRTVHLTKGWNWIGFISIRNQSVTQALGNHNPSDGDLIKGKSQFAIYNTQLGWVGSLQAMVPGAGYMYKSADTIDFVYPFAGMFKSGAEINENIYTNATWEVDHSKFASNMTAITKIVSDCEYLNDKQDLTLGVFDNTGMARGISPIEMHGESGLSFATIGGLNNEGLAISILDNSTQEAYTLNQEMDYVSNMHLGYISNPYEINISEEVCFKMQADAGVLSDYFKVYPTLIGEVQHLDFISNAEETESKGFLYNIWGQKVWEANLDIEQGFNRIELDFNNLELAPGIYHFVLQSDGVQRSVKLISK